MIGVRNLRCARRLSSIQSLTHKTRFALPCVQLRPSSTEPRPIGTGKVVVVGGGLAGHCAAIEAARAGSSVIILEKADKLGGNSAKASSGINGAHTPAQLERNILDSYNALKHDTLKSGGGLSDVTLVDTLSAGSEDALSWLRSFGLSLTALSQCGGHCVPRTHRFPNSPDGKPLPMGFTTMQVLSKYVESANGIEVKCKATVIKLLARDLPDDQKQVYGVDYSLDGGDNQIIEADAVILASGGYAFDRSAGSLLRKFSPNLCDLPTSSGPQADGEGIKLGLAVGAELVGMEYVQVHPTGLVNPSDPANLSKFLGPEALRGCGGIMLNQEGKRFADELGTREYLTGEIFSHCKPLPNGNLASGAEQIVALTLLNEEAAQSFGKAMLSFYINKGFFKVYPDAGTFAADHNMDPAIVEQTLINYSASAMAGKDEFGKTQFPVRNYNPQQTLYCCMTTPVIHYTMGGLKISSSAEVLRMGSHGEPKPILGLFGAGEVTGGVNGRNRLAGNSLLECVVFGRLAGQRAAAIDHSAHAFVNADTWTPLRLRHKKPLEHAANVFEFSFELPSPFHTLPFEAGHAIGLRLNIDGKQEVRYYSPISRHNRPGHVDLLVKCDPDHGTMSRHMYFMKPGDYLEFKGPVAGFDWSLTDGSVTKIGMIAGGVGVSPMVQIIREVLHADAKVDMKLLWAAEKEDELMYKDKLQQVESAHPNLHVVYSLGHPPTGWKGETGMITKTMIHRHLFPPSPGTKIVICGPYKMCQAMKQALRELGYTEDMFYSYM